MTPPDALTGRQITAARALTSTSQAALAEAAGVPLKSLRRMEANSVNVPASSQPCKVTMVRRALEKRGAQFIAEDANAGPGVRLRLTRPDTRQLGRWESEGGRVADDDIQ